MIYHGQVGNTDFLYHRQVGNTDFLYHRQVGNTDFLYDGQIGITDMLYNRVELRNEMLSKQNSRRKPPRLHDKVRQNLKEMKDLGVFKESTSPFALVFLG